MTGQWVMTHQPRSEPDPLLTHWKPPKRGRHRRGEATYAYVFIRVAGTVAVFITLFVYIVPLSNFETIEADHYRAPGYQELRPHPSLVSSPYPCQDFDSALP
jgi:type VI protein secretion system component VasF